MISSLFDALAERGFDTLTDVQQAVTAPGLETADLMVSAQTGSGKTVGFGLAIAPTLFGEAGTLPAPAAPLALVVAPTRELALQVQRELSWLYQKTGAWVVSCVGGMDARSERRALERGAHIVVGTPGRLRDHIEREALDLSEIRAVVLDEADEMLDLGFREDLEFMLARAPAERRTLLFSATVPPAIAELAKSYQRDAVRVTTLTKGQQHADIEYRAIQVSMADTEHAIINLLRFHDARTAIVFANTRATVARLTARFANRGFAVVSLSGELSQDERGHALQALRDGRARVCVATDVAARGIDLPNLELVIHADLPTNTEALLHRSGRTGRAGRKGISALIVPDKATKKAERLLKWAKIEATWGFAPSPEEIQVKDQERLLADPAWEAAPGDDETIFAERLLAQYSPEQIAVACLRLYQARLSAPEELNAPGAKADRRDTFGPAAWVSLSVGRAQNAEPRWLLPLLCRAGNLEKAQIGKIRMAETETFVELSEAAIEGFMAALGADGVLEDDIRVKRIDALPEIAPQRRQRLGGERQTPGGRPEGARPERAKAPGRPPRKPEADAPARGEADRPRVGEAARPRSFDPDKPRKAEGDQPRWTKTDRPQQRAGADRAPRDATRPERAAKAEGKTFGSGSKPARAPKGAAGPSDKPYARPDRGALGAKSSKPAARKPAGADTAGKPAAGRPADAPSPKRRGANDPSISLGRRSGPGGKPPAKRGGKPGQKPGGKFPRGGGDKPPTRKR